jgi:hypothetical protein
MQLLTTEGILIPVSIVGSMFAGIQMFLESKRFSIRITQEAMIVHRVILKPQTIPWNKIVSMSYSQHTIEMRTTDHQKVKVNIMMDGISALLEMVMSNVNPSVARKISDVIIRNKLLPPDSFDSEGKLVRRGA